MTEVNIQVTQGGFCWTPLWDAFPVKMAAVAWTAITFCASLNHTTEMRTVGINGIESQFIKA